MSVSNSSLAAGADAKRALLAQQRRNVELRRIALVVPVLLYLAIFYAYPVAAMLFRSVHEPHWTLANYRKLFDTDVYVHVLWLTVRISLVVTGFALALGYPVAYVLSAIDRSKSNLLLILVLIPFWTSILVRTYAWMVLLGRNGIINNLLMGLGLVDHPLRLLNTTFAVYIGMIHILLPFMVLPLYSVMRGIDRNLLRAAGNLGARPAAAFRQVFLPLSLPGIAAGSLLVFVLSLGFFITPALIGSPRDLMISILIQQQVNLFNWPFASALATVLLVGTICIFVVFNKVLGVERIFGGVRQ